MFFPKQQLSNLQAQTLNNTEFAERDFLLFNRVPKVGSEQLIELIQRLSVINNFKANRTGSGEPVLVRLTEVQQKSWAKRMYNMGESQSFSTHINYIDFRLYNLPQPIYINMIRDPVERIISWYFYVRAPWRVVQRYKLTHEFDTPQFYKRDFAECVLNKNPECLYPQDGKFRETGASHSRQTLFFCGHEAICEPFNSQAALQRSKQIVESEYAVVGSWEDVNVTLKVLENYIPKYFNGVTELYYDETFGLAHEKRNANSYKAVITEEIKNILRRNFTREYEFYYFCKQRLYRQYLALENLTPFNSQGALERAKHIVETKYAVVGSWEDVNVTLKVLEYYVPRFFRGVTKLYYGETSGMYQQNRNGNSWKPHISEEIKIIIRRNFTREYEFYYFCKQRLYKQYLALLNLKK